MKTYIINLEKDIERKKYMDNLLNPFPFLEKSYIKAVYGKTLNEQDLNKKFDIELARKRYGRPLNPGEIGCTLSHFKCYSELLTSNKPYALLLEDDVTIMRDFSTIDAMAASLPSDKPWVLFLSADYWYTSMRKFDAQNSIASVYDAVGTYAYIINRKGAELIISKNRKASNVADHWSMYRRQGLKLYAVFPYMIDANLEEFESTVEQMYFGEVRKNMPLGMRLAAFKLSAVKRLLLIAGHFVSKIRINQL